MVVGALCGTEEYAVTQKHRGVPAGPQTTPALGGALWGVPSTSLPFAQLGPALTAWKQEADTPGPSAPRVRNWVEVRERKKEKPCLLK